MKFLVDQDVYAEFERVLTSCAEQGLQAAFVVIEPGRHRMRKLERNP